MSYQVNFTDNQLVTAEALNAAAEELGGGVLAFQDDMTYGVEDLNAISGSLISKGVVHGCRLTIAEGQVKVNAGVLYMSDGKRVEIDDEGVLLAYEAGVKNYVWFYQDIALGLVAPRCTVTPPEGEDYVVLGEITESGVVSRGGDKALMKHSYLGLNRTEFHTITFVWNETNLDETLIAEIELDKVGYRFVIAYCDERIDEESQYHCFCGFADLTTGECYSVLSTHYPGSKLNWGSAMANNNEGKLHISYFDATTWNYCRAYLRFELGEDNVLRAYRSGMKVGTGRTTPTPNIITIKLKLC